MMMISEQRETYEFNLPSDCLDPLEDAVAAALVRSSILPMGGAVYRELCESRRHAGEEGGCMMTPPSTTGVEPFCTA